MAADYRQLLLRNWPIKLTALVLSAILWAVVAAEEPTTQLVPVSVVVTYANGQPVTQPLPPVRALYAGPAREMIKLYAQPPLVRKIIPDTAAGRSLTLELGLADLVTARDIEVTAQDIQPRMVTVDLADVTERRVPVVLRVTATPDTGHGLLGPVSISPESVTVRGRLAEVSIVDSVPTLPLTLTGLTETTRRGVPLDTRGLGDVRLTPSQVLVTVQVSGVTERLFAGVPVRIDALEPEAWVSDRPAVAVTVRGLSDRLARLTRDSVTVLASVSGREDREAVPLYVIPPPGLTARVSPDTVLVRRRPGA